jgi:heme exporter protein CcmD
MSGAYVVAAFAVGGLMMLAVLAMGVHDRQRRRAEEEQERARRGGS